jgi:probable HAF family extracellular repeat protein
MRSLGTGVLAGAAGLAMTRVAPARADTAAAARYYAVEDLAPWQDDEASGSIHSARLGGDGRLVASSYWPLPARSFVRIGGRRVNLSPLPGNDSTDTIAINDHGDVVGHSWRRASNPQTRDVVIWPAGQYDQPLPLGTLGTYSRATAINNNRQVVGQWSAGRGFFWDGQMHDLGTLPGPYFLDGAVAQAINDAGRIVGRSIDLYGVWPVVWQDPAAPIQRMGRFDSGYSITVNDINTDGTSVGRAPLSGNRIWHAAKWDVSGRITDLGGLMNPASNYGAANAINDAGEIAGWSVGPSSDTYATLWAEGKVIDLHTAAVGLPAGYHLVDAIDIDDRGDILAWGYRSDTYDHQRLFLLTPCRDVDGNGTPDNDGDSLCDDWEVDGVRDKDGNVLLDLPGMGADSNHKDVFVEIDYMDCAQGGCAPGDTHNHRPLQQTLTATVQAFQNAPVANPDGASGINLHFVGVGAGDLVGQAIPEVMPIRFGTRGPGAADDFDDLKSGSNDPANPGDPCGTGDFDGHFGTFADRTSANCEQILEARRRVFRYVIFGHDQVDLPGQSGISEVGGNDFLVTLEPIRAAVQNAASLWGTTFAQEWSDAEAGTLMHELGHTLGLHHGGRDDVNCKPNYLSVMRYGRQFNEWGRASDLPGIADGTRQRLNRPLDYSRWALPALEEDASLGGLDETKGIQGPAGQRTLFGVGGAKRVGPSAGLINWNGNANPAEVGIGSDVNFISDKNDCQASSNQKLTVQNDWLSLDYDFRDSPDYADGDTRVTVPKVPEQTAMEYGLGVLGDGDADGDGMPDYSDNCVMVANPDQADADENGIGDVCERPADDTPPAITASLSPSPNAAGWHRQPVTVTWTLADPESGIATSTGCDLVTVAVETAGLTLNCSATNGAGLNASKSVLIRLDRTPPQLTASRTPAANSSGWNSGDVSVSFACADDLSGVASCTPATLVLTAEGAGQSATATAVDQAGNSASATIGGINIDKTAPTLACSASPNELWPANHKMVAVQAAVSVNDALSGPGGFVLVSAASNEPDDGLGDGDTANDVQGFVLGTPDVAGLVRAERSGRGAGRTYGFSYRGSDAAGNPGTCTAAVSVPHDRGH